MVLTVPPNQLGWDEINTCVAVTVLATIAVVLRFFTRLYRKTPLGADDWTALVALILLISMFIQMILWVFLGGQGYHVGELIAINPSIVEAFGQIFYANEVTYAFASPAVKISIILFYRRIFPLKYIKVMSNALIGIIILWGLVLFIGSSTQCIPLAKAWNPQIPGTCFNTKQFILGMGGSNIVLDFAILVMPIKPIWGLHRPWQDRVALTGVFLVGGFVCFASIYRIAKLMDIDPTDITYTTHYGAIWTFVEPCIGLACGCLPVIRGLLPAYSVQRANARMSSRTKTPIFSFNTRQETQISGARPDKMTEEYYRMPSGESFDELPMQDTDKIRVHTTINIHR